MRKYKLLVPLRMRMALRQILKSLFVRVNRMSGSSVNRNGENLFTKGLYVYEKHSHLFTGYYDLCPFFPDCNKLLALRTFVSNRPLKKRTPAEIGIVNFDRSFEGSFIPLALTDAWCWQQGCRLQWIPGREGKLSIFNCSIDGGLGSAVLDVRTGEIIEKHKTAIYSLSSNGCDALTLNFSRLHRLRPGYGYAGFCEEYKDDKASKGDGIWRFSLKNGSKSLLLSLSDLSHFEQVESMVGAEHYVNHLSFNPSGKRFLFIHIWLNRGRQLSRLITMNLDGSHIKVLNNEGLASHYTWRNDVEILHYSKHNDEEGYYLYSDETLNHIRVGRGHLNGDGHPTFFPDGNLFLADTYPDKFGEQSLILFDIEKNKSYIIGSCYLPPEFSEEVRCDLHPCLDRCGNFITINVVYREKRGVLVIPTNKILKEKNYADVRGS
jgi:hypothetical protein